MSTPREGSPERVFPDLPMVNFGHCRWTFAGGFDGDGMISVEKEAVAALIRAALTDEILDEIDDVAIEAANHTQGVWDEVAY